MRKLIFTLFAALLLVQYPALADDVRENNFINKDDFNPFEEDAYEDEEDTLYNDCISAIYGGLYAIVCPVEKGIWQLRYVDYETEASLSEEHEDVPANELTPPYPLVKSKELTFYTRNYGNRDIYLYSSPNADSKVVATIHREDTKLHPYALDESGDFVLVRYRGKWGWLSLEWYCANPYTNCC